MNPTTYGASLTPDELAGLLDHLLRVNLTAEAAGRRKYPLCIWGRHGIGKTEIVRDFARERGLPLVYVAPAQFEEMGDLLGMPQIREQDGRAVTSFRPPDWVPVAGGPGILLLDDINRADDRILRGLMPLLLDFRLLSWALPPRWQIVLTANPDDADYSVTPMDEALLTRLRHVTLHHDLRAWARWAERHGVDGRGIAFALTYPDTITGRRTTPRTLVQFLDAIAGIEDLTADLPLVQTLARASLDEETVAAFLSFVRQQGYTLPAPGELLAADDFDRQVRQPLARLVQGDPPRVDLLATLCTRLAHHLQIHGLPPGPRSGRNLKAFLLLDFLPADLRFALAQDIAAAADPALPALLSDPDLAGLLLGA